MVSQVKEMAQMDLGRGVPACASSLCCHSKAPALPAPLAGENKWQEAGAPRVLYSPSTDGSGEERQKDSRDNTGKFLGKRRGHSPNAAASRWPLLLQPVEDVCLGKRQQPGTSLLRDSTKH